MESCPLVPWAVLASSRRRRITSGERAPVDSVTSREYKWWRIGEDSADEPNLR